MLDALGVELLGRVLATCAPRDLRAARTASRRFDEASRAHTDRSQSLLTLNPLNTDRGSRCPNWERFPRLRSLVLRWRTGDGQRLRGMFGGGNADGTAAAVSRVEEIEADIVDATSWAAVLRHAPAVKRIQIRTRFKDAAPVLAAVASSAPQLAALCASLLPVNTSSAALIAAQLPALRELRVQGGDSVTPGTWAALPCSRLTALHFDEFPSLPRAVAEAAAWPMLRVLDGVFLSADAAEPLARGLPNLERLSFVSVRDGWGSLQAGCAAFGSVAWACIFSEGGDLASSPHALARLLPHVERLEWCGGAEDGSALRISAEFAPLTRLAQLWVGWCASEYLECTSALQPAAWESLAKLTELEVLSVCITPEQLPRLSRLPPSVESLTVHVATESGDPEEEEDAEEGMVELGAVLEAAARAPGVRALHVSAPRARLRHTRGLARASSAKARLRELEVFGPGIKLHDICVLAMLPGLTRLACVASELAVQDPGLRSVVAQHAADGLLVEVSPHTQSTVTPPLEPW